MKNLITSDNLTFTKKKCNCGLKANKSKKLDINKRKGSTKKRKTKNKIQKK